MTDYEKYEKLPVALLIAEILSSAVYLEEKLIECIQESGVNHESFAPCFEIIAEIILFSLEEIVVDADSEDFDKLYSVVCDVNHYLSEANAPFCVEIFDKNKRNHFAIKRLIDA